MRRALYDERFLVLCPWYYLGISWVYRLWSGLVAIWQVHCSGQMEYGSNVTFFDILGG